MVTQPHLFLAEISLDLSRGEFRSCLEKLEPEIHRFRECYTFQLFYGRALKGAGRTAEAVETFSTCCRIAPFNDIAWRELLELHVQGNPSSPDPVISELEQLSHALSGFQIPKASETCEPTTLREQKQPFSDDEEIPVPTESLATLFIAQGAYRKAINVYTDLIEIHPSREETYRKQISALLEKL
ncbi:hypothetical protein INT08_03630 [Prosthecochloris sp. N3]|uniref:Tetratricopeptide repeat protein n=1 Tax=Prosthecochloris ethylica TaxID=2743976 RepID=A0ABR9XQV9_9CHLB|nr:hypothetical protein [Prosthecochloris ethylica]MBF0585486.1 hypothetical protein [Prosthecochloris ethylica]MBF0636272.1 hypothetical protein [Prosthecochloris ethylica]NUK46716.1 hypothetical protein [Prosthecochloris ethylica]